MSVVHSCPKTIIERLEMKDTTARNVSKDVKRRLIFGETLKQEIVVALKDCLFKVKPSIYQYISI